MFKESALANLILTLAPFAIGLVVGLFLPGSMKNPGGCAWAAMAFYGVGFASFAAAKIQNILKGHYISFGSSLMSKPAKLAYRMGYAFMVLALFLTLALLVGSKFTGEGH